MDLSSSSDPDLGAVAVAESATEQDASPAPILDDLGDANDFDDAASDVSSASDADGEPATGPGGRSKSQAGVETFTIEALDAPAEPSSGARDTLTLDPCLPDAPAAQPTEQSAEGSLSILRSASSVPHLTPSTSSGPQGEVTAATTSEQHAPSENDEAWRRQSKHFFILTASGKPIYTFHGDADSLAGLMALITALVSVVQAQGDKMQYLATAGMVVLFVLRGPVILVATSKLGEPADALQRQLELLYRQILLVVTAGLERILLRNAGYDVRSLLEGVGSVLHALVGRLCRDASYLLPGIQPVPIPQQERAVWQQALAEAVKSSGALYGVILVSGGRVVAIEYEPGARGLQPLDAADLMCLDNFVCSNANIRQQQGEAFCPLCLPAYNPAAFLHAYLHFLTAPTDIGLYLALLGSSAEQFHAMSQAREQLEGQLHRTVALNQLQRQLQPNGTACTRIDRLPASSGGGKLGTTPLWHFMARFASRKQVAVAEPGPTLRSPLSVSQLSVSYTQLHSLVMDYPPGGRPNKLVWLCTERYVSLAVLDTEVELYMTLDPLCDKATALRCAEQLRKHLGLRASQADLLLPGVP